MENKVTMDRRSFLIAGGTAVSGLLLAFDLPPAVRAAMPELPKTVFAPNAFLNISPDNEITVWVTRSEMGQGVRTSLPMILADELEADWSRIVLKQASPGVVFKGIRLRTSGSGSIAGSWGQLRTAGASAREMLVSAAAGKWKVSPSTCRAEGGRILHVPTGRRVTFGDVADSASKLPIPEKPTLKDPKDYKFIGRPMKRVDGKEIVCGKAVYGLDVKIPGMRYAVVARPPVLGAKPLKWADAKAKAIKGVVSIVPVTTGLSQGVAIVAENLWTAIKGRDALTVTWDESKNKDFSSANFKEQLISALAGEKYVTRNEGDAATAFETAALKLDATYEYPHQAHAPLETMNCVAHVYKDGCEIWSSTQAPESIHQDIAKMLEIDPEKVKVNVPLLGGGFGRRLQIDYVPEAVEVSKAIGAPVQIVWTRADDMKHGFFHSWTMCRMQAAIDQNKRLTALKHSTASSDLSVLGPPTLDAQKYAEGLVPWGGYDSPYVYASYQSIYAHVDSPVPTGPWRAVGYPQNVFARECFVDEIANAIGKDPVAFRVELLDGPPVTLGRLTIDRAVLRKVVEVAAEKAEWSKPLRKGDRRRWGRGIACNVYHGATVCAQVAEVSVGEKGDIKIERIVFVVDCGQVINPLGFIGQVESGIVWGLSPVLHDPITFKNGQAEQSSFADFNVLRMDQMPKVEVHWIPSTSRPWGIGEQSVPPVAPAVGNAVFNATGKRLRSLPFRLNEKG